jgi:hypothetical protein
MTNWDAPIADSIWFSKIVNSGDLFPIPKIVFKAWISIFIIIVKSLHGCDRQLIP